jgi:hypothetical protein
MQRAQGFGRRDAGREAQLLDVDICFFIGMAIVTPSTAIKNTQASMSGTDID